MPRCTNMMRSPDGQGMINAVPVCPSRDITGIVFMLNFLSSCRMKSPGVSRAILKKAVASKPNFWNETAAFVAPPPVWYRRSETSIFWPSSIIKKQCPGDSVWSRIDSWGWYCMKTSWVAPPMVKTFFIICVMLSRLIPGVTLRRHDRPK